MLILGINSAYHDTSAAIVRDGVVIAAAEEERFNRVKHTNAFPAQSLRFCLERAGVRLEDLACIAVNFAEEAVARRIHEQATSQFLPTALTPQEFAASWFTSAGFQIDPRKIRFVPHHVSHAASAWYCSGFDEGLILSLDGIGENERAQASGMLFRANGTTLEKLKSLTYAESLGHFYGQLTKLCGFREFDEYKLMGLASYGQRATFAAVFAACARYGDDGSYAIDRVELIRRLNLIVADARGNESAFERTRRDIAAAGQDLLEKLVLHFLAHHAAKTKLPRLAVAGGVALNCTLISRIMAAGLFTDVFVQPAAHDAGCAVGAALHISAQEKIVPPRRRLLQVDWGTDVGEPSIVERTLQPWRSFIRWERADAIARQAAAQLADGAILGWVQGRAEFGPRALGHRSILADPRHSRSRDVVNEIVKQREGFRPFAPSVPEERAAEFFALSPGFERLPFMLAIVPVRAEQRGRLEAITHVDGSARVQTVNRNANPRYWELIDEFGRLTGVPVVLNTSFNNNEEPIVDSVDDAIVSFLSMELNALVIGDYWVTKLKSPLDVLAESVPHLAACAEVILDGAGGKREASVRYRDEIRTARRPRVTIAAATVAVLASLDGVKTSRELVANHEHASQVLGDLQRLWWSRLVRIEPLPEKRG